jgi:hypothetical protein
MKIIELPEGSTRVKLVAPGRSRVMRGLLAVSTLPQDARMAATKAAHLGMRKVAASARVKAPAGSHRLFWKAGLKVAGEGARGDAGEEAGADGGAELLDGVVLGGLINEYTHAA